VEELSVNDPRRDVPHAIHGNVWEDMTVGGAFRTAARTVTESDLTAFVNLCGFNEPLFYDERHAAEGGYGGRLVPGALVYALGEGLVIQTHSFAGTGLAFMHMELDVRRPTFVGDTIDVVVEITSARASSKPGRGVVQSRNTVYNAQGDDVLVYTPVRLVRGRDFTA